MLSTRIRELRLACGWSQIVLAKKLSVSKQAVSNWENGNIQPSVDMLIHLADAFGVTTDYLLGREAIPRLDASGLSTDAVAHFSLLLDDFRSQRRDG